MNTTKLDPSTPHPYYKELNHKYNVTLDAFYGDVVKYVPKIANQTDSDYAAYTARSAFFGVVQPTAAALVGSLTRKPYTLSSGEFPDNAYGSTDVFLQYLFRDQFLGGRTAILVDVGADGKAKLVNFDADDIVNWSEDFVMIKQEEFVSDPKNPYALIEVCSYLELYIDENEIYQNRVWTKTEGRNGKWVAEDGETFLAAGQPLDYIPIFPITPYDNTWDVYTPPLFTQATQNIQHFKQSCDLAHYAHFMAMPTAVVMGDLATYEETFDTSSLFNGPVATESGRSVVKRQANFLLGSTTEPLHLTENSKAAYLEVSGASFTMLRENLKDIEERMFLSGSRLLSIKKGVESVEALQVRAGAESAVLETIVNSVETALNSAFELVAVINRTGPQTIELNKDFTGGDMDPAQVKVLLDLYVAGAITLDQLTVALYDGEVVSEPGTISSTTIA